MQVELPAFRRVRVIKQIESAMGKKMVRQLQNLRSGRRLMNAAGIDVSKGKSMIAVARPFGEIAVKPYEVRHTASELRTLAHTLKSLDGETRVILEHTGRYYEPVAQMLHDAGIFVSAVNPLLIKEYGNNSLRRVKTDKADSLKIARYGLDNWGRIARAYSYGYHSLSTEKHEPAVQSIRQEQNSSEKQPDCPLGSDLSRCERSL